MWFSNLLQISQRSHENRAGRRRARRNDAPRQRSFVPRVDVLEDRILLAWSPIGPAPILGGQTPGRQPVTGRLAAVAGDPSNVNVLYVAAAGGGVWKTINAGATWTPLTDTQTTLKMGALAVARYNPNIIYAGTGEANNSGDSFYGRGVLKSTNGGLTWTLLGTAQFDRRTISQIVIDPYNPPDPFTGIGGTVYLTVNGGGVNGLGGNTGVWKSTDGGSTWNNTTAGISTTQPFTDVAESLADPTGKTLYAAVGNIGGSAVNGVYKTTNGGGNWALLGGGLPSGFMDGRIRVATPTNGGSGTPVVYVSISGTGQPGSTAFGTVFRVMRSADGGVTWINMTPPTNYMGGQGWYDTTLAVDPNNPNQIYVAGQIQVLENISGLWIDISVGGGGGGPHVDHHGISFDATGHLLDGNDGGIWKLDTNFPFSIHWTDLNGASSPFFPGTGLQITTFVGIAQDTLTRDILYGGSQDNGREKFTGGTAWNLIRGGDGGFIHVDPVTPTTVYGEFFGTNLERSIDGGATWTNISPPADDGNFYQPFAVDPVTTVNLVFGNRTLWGSGNQGTAWFPIGIPGANGFNTGGAPIDAVSTNNVFNAIYASAGGKIFVSTDAGATWNERDVPGPLATVQALLAVNTSFAIPGFAFAVHNRFGVGKVFFTFDFGVTWTDDTANLPAIGNDDLPAWSLAFDTTGGGNLYLGTDNGVYRGPGPLSFTTVSRATMPDVQVTGLELNAGLNVLDAGTYGRGVFRIKLTDSLAAAANPFSWQDAIAHSPIPTPIVAGFQPSSRGALAWSAPVSAQAVTPAGHAISAEAIPAAILAGFQPSSAVAPEWSAPFAAPAVTPAGDRMPAHSPDVANLDYLFASNRASEGLALTDTELAASARNDTLTGDALLSDVMLLAAVLSPPLIA